MWVSPVGSSHLAETLSVTIGALQQLASCTLQLVIVQPAAVAQELVFDCRVLYPRWVDYIFHCFSSVSLPSAPELRMAICTAVARLGHSNSMHFEPHLPSLCRLSTAHPHHSVWTGYPDTGRQVARQTTTALQMAGTLLLVFRHWFPIC